MFWLGLTLRLGKMMENNQEYQVLLKYTDENGTHLVCKCKKHNMFHIEGHRVDGPNKTLLKQTPQYFLPISENEVSEEFSKNGKEWIKLVA